MSWKHPLFGTWRMMKTRCYDERAASFKNYGARGITVSDDWLIFENFVRDMGERPPKTTLDRRYNDEGYSKENCRWATKSQQAFNTRLRQSNKHGIRGVAFDQNLWIARATLEQKTITLYHGKDFFEACCARKSWESHL